jgi:hypothetical protein
VDTDRIQLGRANAEVVRRGLHRRVELVESDVTTFADHGDLVICVGGAHAFGGTDGALEALAGRLEQGGTLLLGEGFWEQPPTATAQELFGELYDWDGLLAAADAAGYELDAADRSSLAEWDRFETAWTAGPVVAGDVALQAEGARRAEEYQAIYRGVLGFAWLQLRRRLS